MAVDVSDLSVVELERAFGSRAAIVRPDDEFVERLTDETETAARIALERQLNGRTLIAAVVSTAAESLSVDTPNGQRETIASIRGALLWTRVMTGAMADREAGGSLVLALPQAHDTGDVVTAHGIIGIARSASASLAAQGVRIHVVDRAEGDEATFATLVSVLASDALRWLSGHVLATSAWDIGVLTDDEPLWQLFTDTTAGDTWLERVNAFVHETNRPGWATR